ncbi:cysteine hydrolase family protein [Ancylobacter sp. SL191]|uniref:cysteine hydrolase family protein n=1 Tax=Ancylobacter sp. SL191 TaxID=2995166 RepID=UPI0022714667|nr:isochorismatase family cysteine hydrolase [Ancylobacter sp. SL191]WAC27172.1 cysteine hydrolase [Ancylobacter sp. SL191]
MVAVAHLCLDMQKLFAPEGPWPTPWMERALPNVTAVSAAFGAATVFTRFIPARHPDEEIGTWRGYYQRWSGLTLEKMDTRLLDLVPGLAALTPPAQVVDKWRFSAFSAPGLAPLLNGSGTDTLVITGAETDMCVLSTVTDAVDRGYRVLLVADAVCSSSDEGHEAALAIYRRRFSRQIETLTTTELMERRAEGAL